MCPKEQCKEAAPPPVRPRVAWRAALFGAIAFAAQTPALFAQTSAQPAFDPWQWAIQSGSTSLILAVACGYALKWLAGQLLEAKREETALITGVVAKQAATAASMEELIREQKSAIRELSAALDAARRTAERSADILARVERRLDEEKS